MRIARSTPMQPTSRRTLAIQLVATLVILAWVPGNFLKLLAFATVWVTTFRRFTRIEIFLYLATCALFTAMDLGATGHDVFFFTNPDFARLPIWEPLMWGYYILHLARAVEGPAPVGTPWVAVALAIAFAIPFSTISDPYLLLVISALVLGVAIACFHDTFDLSYTVYMIILGALIEYTGVLSGQWAYPGDTVGGVPLWFVTMWGGVGLFTRRLVLPLLRDQRQAD